MNSHCMDPTSTLNCLCRRVVVDQELTESFCDTDEPMQQSFSLSFCLFTISSCRRSLFLLISTWKDNVIILTTSSFHDSLLEEFVCRYVFEYLIDRMTWRLGCRCVNLYGHRESSRVICGFVRQRTWKKFYTPLLSSEDVYQNDWLKWNLYNQKKQI